MINCPICSKECLQSHLWGHVFKKHKIDEVYQLDFFKQIKNEYLIGDITVTDLSIKYKITRKLVGKTLKYFKVKIKDKNTALRERRIKIKNEIKQKCIEDFERGLSVDDICIKHDRSIWTVYEYLENRCSKKQIDKKHNIIVDFKKGGDVKDIAKRYNITKERVYRIIGDILKTRNKELEKRVKEEYEKGELVKDIRERNNISDSVVRRIIKNKREREVEYKKIVVKRFKEKNDIDFFEFYLNKYGIKKTIKKFRITSKSIKYLAEDIGINLKSAKEIRQQTTDNKHKKRVENIIKEHWDFINLMYNEKCIGYKVIAKIIKVPSKYIKEILEVKGLFRNTEESFLLRQRKNISVQKYNIYKYKEKIYEASYEIRFAIWLEKNNIEFKTHDEIQPISYMDGDKQRKYYSDFYIPKWNKYVELKGVNLKEGIKKIEKVRQSNPEIEILIYTKKELKEIGAWDIDYSEHKIVKSHRIFYPSEKK